MLPKDVTVNGDNILLSTINRERANGRVLEST